MPPPTRKNRELANKQKGPRPSKEQTSYTAELKSLRTFTKHSSNKLKTIGWDGWSQRIKEFVGEKLGHFLRVPTTTYCGPGTVLDDQIGHEVDLEVTDEICKIHDWAYERAENVDDIAEADNVFMGEQLTKGDPWFSQLGIFGVGAKQLAQKFGFDVNKYIVPGKFNYQDSYKAYKSKTKHMSMTQINAKPYQLFLKRTGSNDNRYSWLRFQAYQDAHNTVYKNRILMDRINKAIEKGDRVRTPCAKFPQDRPPIPKETDFGTAVFFDQDQNTMNQDVDMANLDCLIENFNFFDPKDDDELLRLLEKLEAEGVFDDPNQGKAQDPEQAGGSKDTDFQQDDPEQPEENDPPAEQDTIGAPDTPAKTPRKRGGAEAVNNTPTKVRVVWENPIDPSDLAQQYAVIRQLTMEDTKTERAATEGVAGGGVEGEVDVGNEQLESFPTVAQFHINMPPQSCKKEFNHSIDDNQFPSQVEMSAGAISTAFPPQLQQVIYKAGWHFLPIDTFMAYCNPRMYQDMAIMAESCTLDSVSIKIKNIRMVINTTVGGITTQQTATDPRLEILVVKDGSFQMPPTKIGDSKLPNDDYKIHYPIDRARRMLFKPDQLTLGPYHRLWDQIMMQTLGNQTHTIADLGDELPLYDMGEFSRLSQGQMFKRTYDRSTHIHFGGDCVANPHAVSTRHGLHFGMDHVIEDGQQFGYHQKHLREIERRLRKEDFDPMSTMGQQNSSYQTTCLLSGHKGFVQKQQESTFLVASSSTNDDDHDQDHGKPIRTNREDQTLDFEIDSTIYNPNPTTAWDIASDWGLGKVKGDAERGREINAEDDELVARRAFDTLSDMGDPIHAAASWDRLNSNVKGEKPLPMILIRVKRMDRLLPESRIQTDFTVEYEMKFKDFVRRLPDVMPIVAGVYPAYHYSLFDDITLNSIAAGMTSDNAQRALLCAMYKKSRYVTADDPFMARDILAEIKRTQPTVDVTNAKMRHALNWTSCQQIHRCRRRPPKGWHHNRAKGVVEDFMSSIGINKVPMYKIVENTKDFNERSEAIHNSTLQLTQPRYKRRKRYWNPMKEEPTQIAV